MSLETQIFKCKTMDHYLMGRKSKHLAAAEIYSTKRQHPSSFQQPSGNLHETLWKGHKYWISNGRERKITIKRHFGSLPTKAHPSTGIAPVAMLFRDRLKTSFPRQRGKDKDVSHVSYDEGPKIKRTKK